MPAYFKNRWGVEIVIDDHKNDPKPEPLSAPASEPLPEPMPEPTQAVLPEPEPIAVAESLPAPGDSESLSSDSEPAKPRRRRRHTQRGRRRNTPAPREAAVRYHQSRCTICRHRHRDLIEEDFLHWLNPLNIEIDYKVGWRSVYRHANAMGLFARRDANMRFALSAVIEQCHATRLSADSIIRAVRAYTRITPDGQWVDPPTRVVVSYEGQSGDSSKVSEVADARKPRARLRTASLGNPSLGHTAIDLSPDLSVNENQTKHDATP